MASLRKINERNQVTLSPDVLRDAGMEPGSLLSIEARDGKIVLERRTLAEDDFSEADWAAMDKLVKRQVKTGKYAEYSNPADARRHLRRLSK